MLSSYKPIPVVAHAKSSMAAVNFLRKRSNYLPAKLQFGHAICNIVIQTIKVIIHLLLWCVPINGGVLLLQDISKQAVVLLKLFF